MAAVLAGSFLLELVRSFSSAYFPNTWQLALGLFLLLVIRFLPDGLGSLLVRPAFLRRRPAPPLPGAEVAP
jgi:branched-chain amino acid transport system permease protein